MHYPWRAVRRRLIACPLVGEPLGRLGTSGPRPSSTEHCGCGRIRIAPCKRRDDFAMFGERLLDAAGSCAGPQSLNPQLIVQFVEQHPLEPLTVRAANDAEAEVLTLRVLMISRR